MKFNFALKEEEKHSPEELEKKRIKHKQLQRTLEKNYGKTFIKNVERAANRRFCNDKIKKIKLEFILNILTKINIYDHNNNLIHDKKIEDQIKKFYEMKKKANDSNSDRYFVEKKHKPNQTENLLNRSLGEDCC